MKYLFTLLLSFGFLVCTAQKLPENITIQNSVAGIVDGHRIPAKKYSIAPFVITGCTTDVDTNLLYITYHDELDKDRKNYVACYNIKDDSFVFQYLIKGVAKNIQFYKDYFIRDDGSNAIAYSASTGKKMWSRQGLVPYVNTRFSRGVSFLGVGVGMRTGEEQWYSPIDNAYGWGDVYMPDSSTFVVAANGLQCIDVRDGKGWYHKMATGSVRYGKAIAADVLGASPTSRIGVGMCSNICFDNNFFYLAGTEELMCVDRSGELAWQVKLPSPSGSSRIWVNGDTLFMVNRGYARMGSQTGGTLGLFLVPPIILAFPPTILAAVSQSTNHPVYAGAPFMAAFDRITGNLLYTMPLGMESIVLDEFITDDEVFLLCNNGIYNIDRASGRRNAFVNTENDGKYKGFRNIIPGDNIYLTTSIKENRSLVKLYPDQHFLRNSNNDILCFDNALKTTRLITADKLLVRSALNNSLNIVTGANKPYLEKQGRPMLGIAAMPDRVAGNRLLNIESGGFVITDISGL